MLVVACGASGQRPAEGSDEKTEQQATPSTESAPSAPMGQSVAAFEQDSVGFLSAIPLDVSERAKGLITSTPDDTEFARALRVRVTVAQGSKDAGELSRRSKIPVVNGTFQISDLSKLGSRDAPRKGDRKSSFVIDYEEASFKPAAEEFEKSGKKRSPDAISAFAGEYIKEKSYARSFDVASKVAMTRSGDCTEHAVLTAALLRRFGFDARVVFGIVLVGVSGPDLGPDVRAFGHAWVERHDRSGWRIVDAALGGAECTTGRSLPTVCGVPDGVARRLAYLPMNLLKDESASYGRALMDEVGVESVVALEVDANGTR